MKKKSEKSMKNKMPELNHILLKYYINNEFTGPYSNRLIGLIKNRFFKYKPKKKLNALFDYAIYFNSDYALLCVYGFEDKYGFFISKDMKKIAHKIKNVYTYGEYDYSDFNLTKEFKVEGFNLGALNRFDWTDLEFFVNGYYYDYLDKDILNNKYFQELLKYLRDYLFDERDSFKE